LTPENILELGTTGKDIQLCNGFTNSNSIYSISYKSESFPFYFTTSRSIGSLGLSKEKNVVIREAREGVVVKDSAQFYFAFGDVKVNEQKIGFRIIPDTIRLNNLQLINAYLETEPFLLSDNSDFNYSVQYGISDSLSNKYIK